MLPNFIIVGAAKAGTTSLYYYLSQHPQVFMSTPKEVNYFSREEIEAQKLYYKDFRVSSLREYEALFQRASGKLAVGEASVSYLFYPQTPSKIKAVIPDAKIIIILRNPVTRGYSHYLMDKRLGLVDVPYRDIVFKTSRHKNSHLYFQQYVELGLYYEQVKRYLEVFGKERVRVELADDLQSDCCSTVNNLCDFLGLDKLPVINAEQSRNKYWISKSQLIQRLYSIDLIRGLASRIFSDAMKDKIKKMLFMDAQKPRLDNDIASFLLKTVYWHDIKKLEGLLTRDLSGWYQVKTNE